VSCSILVTDLGTILMRDDAIGPYCVEYVRADDERAAERRRCRSRLEPRRAVEVDAVSDVGACVRVALR
jgi:hypothetical protein